MSFAVASALYFLVIVRNYNLQCHLIEVDLGIIISQMSDDTPIIILVIIVFYHSDSFRPIVM